MKARNVLLKSILVLVLVSFLSSFSSSLIAQSVYSGPATSNISGGALVSTGTIEKSGFYIHPGRKVRNVFWEKYNPDYIDNELDNSTTILPSGNNLIIDKIYNKIRTENLDSTAAVVIDFEGIPDRGSNIPPDPVMAVGPNHIIACVNTEFRIFDKAGNELFSTSAEPWFNNVVSSNDAFDPQIIYDHFEGRWVQLWTGGDLTTESFYLISVSDDDDPMGDWYNYAFPGDKNGATQVNTWPDYPKLGYDQNTINMSGRLFTYQPNAFFQYCQIRWVSKNELYSANGGPVNYTDIWDLRDPQSLGVRIDGPPVAAVHMDSSDATYLLVDSPYTLSNFATLWKIENHFTTPTITATNIATTSAYPPLDGQQLDGGQAINVGRRTYRASVYQDGSIWGAANIRPVGVNNTTFARYVRIDVNTNSLLEDYAIGATNFYYLYPDIILDEFNNMVMVYTRSGLTEYAGFGYTGRKDTDPLGYLASTTILKEGEANYVKTFSGTRNRWGDYMGIAQDPENRGVMWALVEYAESPANTWGTWIAAFTHLYAASGVVKDNTSQLPIEFASIEVTESGKIMVTDSTGVFDFGAPTENINLNVSAFSYQDTVITKTLTMYSADEFDVMLLPEVESTISGQILDSLGNGVYAQLKFYAEGNPYPGVYATIASDTNGNYSFTTIIGNYDIEIFPESPYAFKKQANINLNTSGLSHDITVAIADVMLVDDDGGMEYEQFYFLDLENIGVSYHHWDITVEGLPTANYRDAYPNKNLIWFTGDSSSMPLTAAEHDELLDHITNDGKLFLTGQDIVEMNSGSQLTNTIGIDYVSNWALALILGISGDPVSNGLVFNVSGFGGADNQTSKDILTVTDTIHTNKIFHYGGGTGNPAAVRYANDSETNRVVFLGFGFESINDATRRQTLLTNTLNFLNSPVSGIDSEPAIDGIPRKFALSQNYPNPFNPTTTIEYSVASKTQVEIKIYNSLGQRVVTLLNKELNAGKYETNWNGLDSKGNKLSSGVYYYQMITKSGYNDSKKLLLLK
jgi:flagellar hook capping protein FlgD/carboxypeptidase-like protein